MKQEHKEYIKLCVAMISLWVVHKLINHQHHQLLEGLPAENSKGSPARAKKEEETIPYIPSETRNANKGDPIKDSPPTDKPIAPPEAPKDPPGTNSPKDAPLFTQGCPWYKNIIGGCEQTSEAIEEPNLEETNDEGIVDKFKNLF